MDNRNGRPARWTRPRTLSGRLIDRTFIFAGVALVMVVCRVSMGASLRAVLWSLTLCFYFFFYRRIAHVVYWSYDTFRLVRRNGPGTERATQEDAYEDDLPTFHILIASYNASQSIGPVLRAIAHQDYPRSRYCAWVITEHSEQVQRQNQVDALVSRVLRANSCDADARILAPFLWRCASERLDSFEEWICEVTSGNLRQLLSGEGVRAVLLEDLLCRLLHLPDREAFYSSAAFTVLALDKKEITAIEEALRQIDKRVNRVINDFSKLLGSSQIYKRKDLEVLFVSALIRQYEIRKIGTCLCQRFAISSGVFSIPERHTIERLAKVAFASTQSTTQQLIDELSGVNIRHLDPHNRGPKPGALNAAYRIIRDEGLLTTPIDTYFIIIDSDSLLPSNALSIIARDVRDRHDPPGILQMVAIPTANFFSGNWYSKFISFADSIGAVGKWARSTRNQLKPDLHAGSGVVVPATLAEFIANKTGHPWEETTLTEDARLIVGQFGAMNCVRNKTRAVPIYLVEAVPEGDTFFETYKSFWNQRRRWTVGGFDEFVYMLHWPTWLRHTRFDPISRSWEQYCPDLQEQFMSRLRQAHRLWLWVWDHFIWGIGGLIALTHWWLASVMVGYPGRPIAWAGLIALLTAPLIFLLVPGRKLYWFIPGGLSHLQMVGLYFLSFGAIWLYCLPVVATQFACIFGFRAKIIEWRPTQKPRYQAGTPFEIEDL